MKKPLHNIVAGIAATLLGCSAVPAASASSAQTQAPVASIPQNSDPLPTEQLGTNVRNGTVVFMTPTHMVVSCRHKGKTAQLDLVLNRVTVRKGEIAVGSPVTVHYRTKDNRNFATSIQLRKYPLETESESSPY
jgi:hypothetical protein